MGAVAHKKTPDESEVLWSGKRIRTRDIQLGKLTLYQLSYSREGADAKRPPPKVNTLRYGSNPA